MIKTYNNGNNEFEKRNSIYAVHERIKSHFSSNTLNEGILSSILNFFKKMFKEFFENSNVSENEVKKMVDSYISLYKKYYDSVLENNSDVNDITELTDREILLIQNRHKIEREEFIQNRMSQYYTRSSKRDPNEILKLRKMYEDEYDLKNPLPIKNKNKNKSTNTQKNNNDLYDRINSVRNNIIKIGTSNDLLNKYIETLLINADIDISNYILKKSDENNININDENKKVVTDLTERGKDVENEVKKYPEKINKFLINNKLNINNKEIKDLNFIDDLIELLTSCGNTFFINITDDSLKLVDNSGMMGIINSIVAYINDKSDKNKEDLLNKLNKFEKKYVTNNKDKENKTSVDFLNSIKKWLKSDNDENDNVNDTDEEKDDTEDTKDTEDNEIKDEENDNDDNLDSKIEKYKNMFNDYSKLKPEEFASKYGKGIRSKYKYFLETTKTQSINDIEKNLKSFIESEKKKKFNKIIENNIISFKDIINEDNLYKLKDMSMYNDVIFFENKLVNFLNELEDTVSKDENDNKGDNENKLKEIDSKLKPLMSKWSNLKKLLLDAEYNIEKFKIDNYIKGIDVLINNYKTQVDLMFNQKEIVRKKEIEKLNKDILNKK